MKNFLCLLFVLSILLILNSIVESNDLSNSNTYSKSFSIRTNPWTIGILIRLKLSLWAPLFDDNDDQESFKETLRLCINRGITPPQPPVFIRLLEYEHLTGLTGILFEFPKNEDTVNYINRENILLFLIQCREDKLGGEAHIASNILLRNVPIIHITRQKQDSEHNNKAEENYSMATTFTITFLILATTFSIISAYVIYYTVVKNKK